MCLALMYRAGRFLDSRLDPEGSSAYVFKAEILWLWGGPELADSSGFGRFHQPDLRNFCHFHLVNLHVTVEKMFLAKILQSLWFDQGGSTSGRAVTDGTKGKRAPRVMRAQLQLLSVKRIVCPSGLLSRLNWKRLLCCLFCLDSRIFLIIKSFSLPQYVTHTCTQTHLHVCVYAPLSQNEHKHSFNPKINLKLPFQAVRTSQKCSCTNEISYWSSHEWFCRE